MGPLINVIIRSDADNQQVAMLLGCFKMKNMSGVEAEFFGMDEVILEKGKKWFQRGKGGLFIFILAATPLPDDIAGIAAGLLARKI